MKSTLLCAFCLFASTTAMGWNIKGNKIKTEWADKVTPDNVWQNYPRPQLKRADWINLNGLWKYAVTNISVTEKPADFKDEILVPFAIESALSGVARTFTPDNKLWYYREFMLNPAWKGKQIMLHFGAVDYECKVWVNNELAGTHKGGNNPFSFDITAHVKKKNGVQNIVLSVTDPTDRESISRGKQQLNQFGIWYTPVSGIWQTVWLEAVNPTHIRSLLPEADIAQSSITLNFDYAAVKGGEQLLVQVTDQDNVIATIKQPVSEKLSIKIPNPVLWTAETPKLYGLNVELLKGKTVIDQVSSYFAMREVSPQKDENGYNRIFLNNKPVFQYGTLDQGWWPDGLLTPPSAEAMLWDMVQLKNMGFNTIRKHIKVEPALYYYYADSLGLMLWQDMPSGFATARKETEHIRPTDDNDWKAPEAVVTQWKSEINEMINVLRFFPSITAWVVFNEGWGQHNTPEMVQLVQQKDPNRIINGVSGWTDRKAGNMLDIHNYPLTSMIKPAYNNNRISALGEFGGLGLPVENHLWNPEMRNWGYKNLEGSATFINDYAHLLFDLETLIAQGLSAAIYTQTTDVEGEVNGLITYDRKVVKIPATLLHAMHSRLYSVSSAKAVTLIADGQEEKQTRTITLNGITQEVQTPYEIKGEALVICKEEFTADQIYQHLSLWINVNGATKVRINGTPVFEQQVKNTRQYNQINLSDYAYLLRTGKNSFEIEVKMASNGKQASMNFDFGLTAF
ncbi:MAG: beta-galactosidase [Prevotella sp.]|jgi:hypothetical protein|nr:beta-galactosidase [Prevotella sp.]